MPRPKRNSTVDTSIQAEAVPSGSASVREDGDAVLIAVRVKPRSHRESLGPERDGAWPVNVRVLPSEGAANASVISLLARALERAPSTCSLQRGHRGRDKIVRVQNMKAQSARQKLEAFASVE